MKIKKQIEGAIRQTLVIENKQSVPFAVDKIAVVVENEVAELLGALHSIKHDAYPTDIFPPIEKEQWKAIHEMLQREFGMPIDRLSAEYGRLLRKPIIEEAEAALNKFNRIPRR